MMMLKANEKVRSSILNKKKSVQELTHVRGGDVIRIRKHKSCQRQVNIF